MKPALIAQAECIWILLRRVLSILRFRIETFRRYPGKRKRHRQSLGAWTAMLRARVAMAMVGVKSVRSDRDGKTRAHNCITQLVGSRSYSRQSRSSAKVRRVCRTGRAGVLTTPVIRYLRNHEAMSEPCLSRELHRTVEGIGGSFNNRTNNCPIARSLDWAMFALPLISARRARQRRQTITVPWPKLLVIGIRHNLVSQPHVSDHAHSAFLAKRLISVLYWLMRRDDHHDERMS